MMKKLFSLMSAAVLLLVAAGCRQALPVVEGDVLDTTIYSVTILTPDADTLTLSTRGTDPILVPGVLVGDAVRIAYEQLPDGETLRAVTLDITAPSYHRLMPGIWRDCSGEGDVGLVLAEDGSAQAVGVEYNLQDWSIDNEELALTRVLPGYDKNTEVLVYQIEKLDADSLVVAPKDGGRRFSFARQE